MPSVSIEVYSRERPTLLLLTHRFWPSSETIPRDYDYDQTVTLYGRFNNEEVTHILCISRCSICDFWCVLGDSNLPGIEIWDSALSCYADAEDCTLSGQCSACRNPPVEEDADSDSSEEYQSLGNRTVITDSGPEGYWSESSDDEDYTRTAYSPCDYESNLVQLFQLQSIQPLQEGDDQE